MTISHEERHIGREKHRRDHRKSSNEWRFKAPYGFGYDREDELLDQFGKLPDPEYVEEILTTLRVGTLRELAIDIVNGGIEHVKDSTHRLEYAKLLNSWIATAEETVAAGRKLRRIVDRRKKR